MLYSVSNVFAGFCALFVIDSSFLNADIVVPWTIVACVHAHAVACVAHLHCFDNELPGFECKYVTGPAFLTVDRLFFGDSASLALCAYASTSKCSLVYDSTCQHMLASVP